jgi:hypothetical protein
MYIQIQERRIIHLIYIFRTLFFSNNFDFEKQNFYIHANLIKE